MSVIGIVFNFLSIILTGDYNPGVMEDGPLVHEDTPLYDMAYHIRALIGGVL